MRPIARGQRSASGSGPSVECLTVALTVAGRLIRDPIEIWQGYASRTRTLHEYDLADAGDPAILVESEVARTRIIASRVSRKECAFLLQRAVDAPWGCVSGDADLTSTDPAHRGGLFDNAAALYWHFTTPHQAGIGAAKIHKMLHVKRPWLYPVLDQLVRSLYRAQARAWVSRIPGTRPGDSVTFWAAIRQDLVDGDNRSALPRHREELRKGPQTAPMTELPSLRLLDILAWETARRDRHPGHV